MSQSLIYEIIGYIGSFAILLSFLMTSNVKLRIVNTIGDIIIVVYSILISAYPTALCNFFIICINIFYLLRIMFNKQDNYSIVPCTVNDGVFKAFTAKYAKDIAALYPEFDANDEKLNFARFVFSGNEVVGLMAGTSSEGEVNMILDYSIPEFRDCSVGRYAYAHIGRDGLSKVWFDKKVDHMAVYMDKLGFTESEGRYFLNLSAFSLK